MHALQFSICFSTAPPLVFEAFKSFDPVFTLIAYVVLMYVSFTIHEHVNL